MTKSLPLVALAAASLLAACSHHGGRSFSMLAPNAAPSDPTPSDPPPSDPPQSDPTPSEPPTAYDPPPSGTLTRTTNGATGLVGGALHVAGNAVLGVGHHLDLLSKTGQALDQTGHALHDNGLGGVPIVGGPTSKLVQGVDSQLNNVAQVQVVNLPVVGATTPSGNQAIGVSALSQTPATGTVASVGVLNQGAHNQPLNVSVGGAQIVGAPGPAAVNVGVLNGAAAPQGGANPLGAVGGAVNNVVTGVTTPLHLGKR